MVPWCWGMAAPFLNGHTACSRMGNVHLLSPFSYIIQCSFAWSSSHSSTHAQNPLFIYDCWCVQGVPEDGPRCLLRAITSLFLSENVMVQTLTFISSVSITFWRRIPEWRLFIDRSFKSCNIIFLYLHHKCFSWLTFFSFLFKPLPYYLVTRLPLFSTNIERAPYNRSLLTTLHRVQTCLPFVCK